MNISDKLKRLAPYITISDCPSEVFCVRFSPDGKLLAAGCGDGAIRVFNVINGQLAYTLSQPQHNYGFGLPCTSIRFRPLHSQNKTKNVLLSVNANGSIDHWHITSGKCLHSITMEENQLYALDYNQNGSQFIAAGKDHSVYVYDEATKKEICCMKGGQGTLTAGHSNRIFSIKYVPDTINESNIENEANNDNGNMVISGGWDNTIQIWDIRVGQAVRSIYGPHIAGDAIDITNNNNNNNKEIISGSWRADNVLELWDYGSGKKINTIPWNNTTTSQNDGCFLYCAQFSMDGHLIAAGGSGTNEAKVFDHKNNNQLIGTIAGLNRGVFTLDFSEASDKLAIAGADATIRIIDIYDSNNNILDMNRPMTPSIRNAVDPSILRAGSNSTSFPPSPTKIMKIHS